MKFKTGYSLLLAFVMTGAAMTGSAFAGTKASSLAKKVGETKDGGVVYVMDPSKEAVMTSDPFLSEWYRKGPMARYMLQRDIKAPKRGEASSVIAGDVEIVCNRSQKTASVAIYPASQVTDYGESLTEDKRGAPFGLEGKALYPLVCNEKGTPVKSEARDAARARLIGLFLKPNGDVHAFKPKTFTIPER